MSILVAVSFVSAGEFENLGVPVLKHALMNYIVGPDENGENKMLYFNFTGGSLGGESVPSLFIFPFTRFKTFAFEANSFSSWGCVI